MNGYKYYLFITGMDELPRTFFTRVEAEEYMHRLCKKHNLGRAEIVEDDKHEKKYQAGNIKFYINRV